MKEPRCNTCALWKTDRWFIRLFGLRGFVGLCLADDTTTWRSYGCYKHILNPAPQVPQAARPGERLDITTPAVAGFSGRAASANGSTSAECAHPNLPVRYDSEQARGLSAHEVRERFPRFYGPCPDCGEVMIGYASFEHYIAGDW
jgi:hypothetical protein